MIRGICTAQRARRNEQVSPEVGSLGRAGSSIVPGREQVSPPTKAGGMFCFEKNNKYTHKNPVACIWFSFALVCGSS